MAIDQGGMRPMPPHASGHPTRAVRLHGRMDVRLEEFVLPPLASDQILARIVSDSVCMSSYKVLSLGEGHKRVPAGLAEKPIMLGHEFCGEILQVGERWQGRYAVGMRFTVQPVLDYLGRPDAIGYSYPHAGGSATYTLLPSEVMESDCLLPYAGPGWFYGSLAEPVACVLRAFRAQIHRDASGEVKGGPVAGGSMALLGAMGPMGMAALDCALHREPAPQSLVVTSRDKDKLAEAAHHFPVAEAHKKGISLEYLHAPLTSGLAERARALNHGRGFDDVFVFAPHRDLVEAGDALLGPGGCLNMFAGPTDKNFTASLNLYNVHYLGAHVTGTYSAQASDMREALAGMAAGTLDPSFLVTHVGGLNAVPDLLMHLPAMPGWKKLIYPPVDLPLFALSDLAGMAARDKRFEKLHASVAAHGGRWNVEAEGLLLKEPSWRFQGG